MFKALIRALAAILALSPPIASAQQFPTVPGQSVIGRIGLPGDSGPSQAITFDRLKAFIANPTIPTIAALRAAGIPLSTPAIATVSGYYSAADGGGGLFVWNPSSTVADNGGSHIAPTGVATGRWIRQTNVANTYTPEQFGAYHDGGLHDDGPYLRNMVSFLGSLAGGGNIQLGCNTTYVIGSLDTNNQSILIPASNVNILGCGANSTIKMAGGMNTSSSFFAWGIYATGTVSNVRFAHFTIDMNGANNSCGGTCWHSNAALGIATGTNITVEDINFINNPGSNDTVFGLNVATPTVTNLTLKGNRHYNSCNAIGVNAACSDFSADFAIATNMTLSDSRYDTAGHTVATPFELHGTGITASNLVVRDYDTCGIIANEPPSSPTGTVTLGNVSCTNVVTGVVVFSFAGAAATNTDIHDINITFQSGSSGTGVDACSQMASSSGPNTNLMISNIVIISDVTTNLGNNTAGVNACYWSSVSFANIITSNTQGPAVLVDNVPASAIININKVTAANPGRTSTTANQAALIVNNTSGNAASNISLAQINSIGTVRSNIIGSVNATQASIDSNSYAAGATVSQIAWTGTGMSNVLLPAAQTNFRTTGGSGQVVKQGSTGAAFTVGSVAVTDLTGFGTGVAAALGVNIGSAGAPVLLNGALGSPSSAGTMPAFTLGGTVSGGGNQINNVIIGSSTPLAGTFTSVNHTSSIQISGKVLASTTSPSIGGGFCTGASMLGASGTASFVFTVGTSACGGSTGTLTMPAATNGWSCHFANIVSSAANLPDQSGAGSTTSVPITNYSRTTGAAANWTANDQIIGNCWAY